MNIYELEKEATPGPWKVAAGFTLETRQHRYIAQFDASESPHLAREDVILAAYCRNNFMRVLKALKEEHEYHMEHDEHAEIHGTAATCPTCKLIVELEGGVNE